MRQHGMQKAGRFMMSKAEALYLHTQEGAEESTELDDFYGYEESEPLNSPFAVRSNPSPAELREMVVLQSPTSYNYH